MSEGKIGGQQIQMLVVRSFDQPIGGALSVDQTLAAAFQFGLDAVVIAGGALRVQIPDQRLRAIPSGQIRQIDRCRGFTNAPLDTVSRKNFHRILFFRAVREQRSEHRLVFSGFELGKAAGKGVTGAPAALV